MAGKLLYMQAVAFNKHCGNLEIKCFEIRHAPYTNRCVLLRKTYCIHEY